ncbi:MAG TPA: glycosyltransferase [Sporichthyaceae bacterium]|jgi:glycosyltransferase involved in cell wall biosynthesis
MNIGLPVVYVLGGSGELYTPAVPDFETRELDVHRFGGEDELLAALSVTEPQAIVTFGPIENYPRLHRLPYTLRSRWINLPDGMDPEDAGGRALHCFLHDALVPKPADAPPLVSVFTPAYRTGKRIERALRSLQQQSHAEWEWVIVDDSDDDGETWRLLESLAARDHRVSLYRQRSRSGNIGELKNKLGHLCQGAYLVELDHDDELTPYALEWVVEAFRANPDAGFVYSDCAEVYELGGDRSYENGWAWGFGVCRPDRVWTMDGWRDLVVIEAPPINAKTIRHIVSTPNHFRSWRRDFYHHIGGHNRKLHVADDYEICIRSFLNAPVVRIPEVGYLQYYTSGTNTQSVRNQEIQRLVRCISTHYDAAIHARLVQLGADDFCWDGEAGFGNLWSEMPAVPVPALNRLHLPIRSGLAGRLTEAPRGQLVHPRAPMDPPPAARGIRWANASPPGE